MVTFVQNTGIALLAKTTIAQVRPIHSLIGLNKDMRVWEQINTSNVLYPTTPSDDTMWSAPEYHLVAVWWSGSGWRSQSENHSHPPLPPPAQRWDQVWVILSSYHHDHFHDRGQGSWHWREMHVQCGQRRWSCLSGSPPPPPAPPALELGLCPAICMFANQFQRLAFTSNTQSS